MATCGANTGELRLFCIGWMADWSIEQLAESVSETCSDQLLPYVANLMALRVLQFLCCGLNRSRQAWASAKVIQLRSHLFSLAPPYVLYSRPHKRCMVRCCRLL